MFTVEIIEKDTQEVIEIRENVSANEMNAIRKGYAFDPFYTVKISN
jgi:hypothetical protein